MFTARIRILSRNAAAGAALALALAGPGHAEELDIRTGVDILLRDQSTVDAFHFATVSVDLGDGFHLGESVYSAAWGDAGGLFLGGFEAFKRFDLAPGLSFDVGGFVGGGGGAVVVLGDGLMTKAWATLNREFAGGFVAHVGGGWTRVTGSAIDTPFITLGLSRPTDFALAAGHTGNAPAEGLVIASAAGLGRVYLPFSSPRRTGRGDVDPMALVGGEFTFHDAANPNLMGVFSAVGAMAGDGAGYAEWMVGPRIYTRPLIGDRVRGFADAAIGFAGGGTVDTGGGLMVSASAGADIALFRGLHAEAGVLGIMGVTGDFRAAGAFLRGALRFDDPAARSSGVDGGPARHWQFSTGISYQFANDGFRPAGHSFTGNDPILVESGIDLFVTDHLYVTGAGYTVFDGMAGGFAMGTVGLGLEWPLGADWAVAGEIFGGAAAGGGIATGGGLIYGAKAELDYHVTDALSLSLGAGKWASRGTASPWTLHAGVKIPLTSFHGN